MFSIPYQKFPHNLWPSLSRISLPLLSLTEAFIHNIPSIILIVRTRSLIHRKIEVRKHLTRLHAPVRRTTFPQVLPLTAATWMLRSSHHHHGSLLRQHIFHLTKFGDHLNSNAPVIFPAKFCTRSTRLLRTHDPYPRSDLLRVPTRDPRPIRDPQLPADVSPTYC